MDDLLERGTMKVRRTADLILCNGNILTIDDRDTIADSIAISGDRIAAVGNHAQVMALRDDNTRVIDLDGATVMPGLIDGHAHMDREGLKGVYPSLAGARSIAEIQEVIAGLARDQRPGEWIVTMPIGEPPYYWNVPESLAEGRWPTRQELDDAAPHNPVFIRPIWGFWRHTMPIVTCVNTSALERAGIDRDTVSPVDTLQIERDMQGDPTGVFIEWEMQPITELYWFKQIPGFSPLDRATSIPLGAQAYHAYGTTGIFEEHGVANELLRAYKTARRNGTLTMRTSLVVSPNWAAAPDVDPEVFLEAWGGWIGEPALGDDMLKVSGLFVDIEPTRANALRATAAPYTGWAGFNYDTARSHARVKQILMACARHDIRVIVIWPDMIDLLEEVDREIPLRGRRWVLGHISCLTPHDIQRIARMGLVITTHTNRYIYKEGHLLQAKLSANRHRDIVPLRDLLDAGVTVALASDNVPTSLFWPIWQTVTRSSLYSDQKVVAEQKISRMEALRCATINGAALTFDENARGSLVPGKLADLVVLSADPLSVPEDVIPQIHALMTMVGGVSVYEHPNWTPVDVEPSKS
jgi:predicted amidohydrolase YtcJ